MNLGTFGFGAKSEPINGIIGSGSVPKIPKFTAANTIGDSQMSDNGTTVFIGASATSAKAAFEVNSTTKGVFLPRVTTVQQTAIGAGAADTSLLMFNTTNNRYEFYNHADTSYKRLLIPEDITDDSWIDASIASHTGDTNETIMKSILIRANEFVAGNLLSTTFMCKKETIVAQMTNKVYINTSNSLVGAVLLDNYNTNNRLHLHYQRLIVQSSTQMMCTFNTPSTNVTAYPNGQNNFTDVQVMVTGINLAVDNYIIFTSKLDSAAETVVNYLGEVKRERNKV